MGNRIAYLEGLLAECAEFIEGFVDVKDSDEGDGPRPNRAMALNQEIDAALAGTPSPIVAAQQVLAARKWYDSEHPPEEGHDQVYPWDHA